MSINNIIKYTGYFEFDPENVTNKHKNQSSWKKVAFVVFGEDLSEYYSWFIYKRYNLKLNKLLRLPHVSFINDALDNFKLLDRWDNIKEKYNNKPIELIVNVDVRTNGDHWWLNIADESRMELNKIRTELGLDNPYFGLHLSVGRANSNNRKHSHYIHNLLKSGLII